MPSFYFFWGQLDFYFNKFKTNCSGVSPVIGVILMVAVTVIVAAVVAVFGFGFTGDFGGASPKPPTAAITVSSIPETIGIIDMKIQHKSGDTLRAGDWWLSIVPVGQPPAYRVSSTIFKSGDQIITMNVTDYPSATYNVTNRVVNITAGDNPSARLVSGQKYDIKIIVYPFKSMVLDTVVEVR
jgi:flagellin-like protein